MDLQRLDPRVIWLWRLHGLLRIATFWLPAGVGAGIGAWRLGGPALGMLAGTCVLGAGVLLAIAWPPLAWRCFGYALREHDILVQRGVLFRRRTVVPCSRIQYVDTRQGPVERVLGLARLMVFTASGIAADASLPGLDQARAQALRDLLARRGGDDGV